MNRPIDTMMVLLERRADVLRVNIDNIPLYVELCTLVTDLDMGFEITTDGKRYIYKLLETLYGVFAMDFSATLREVVLGTI